MKRMLAGWGGSMQGEIWKLVSPQTNHFTTEINYQCYFWRSREAMSDFTETQRAAEGTACRSVCAWSPRGGISELLCMSGSTVYPWCMRLHKTLVCAWTGLTYASICSLADSGERANVEGKLRLKWGRWRVEEKDKHRLFIQEAESCWLVWKEQVWMEGGDDCGWEGVSYLTENDLKGH